MYQIPSLYGARTYLTRIPDFVLDTITPECVFHKYPCDKDFYELCNILLIENQLTRKYDPFEAVDLYIRLRQILKELFNI